MATRQSQDRRTINRERQHEAKRRDMERRAARIRKTIERNGR